METISDAFGRDVAVVRVNSINRVVKAKFVLKANTLIGYKRYGSDVVLFGGGSRRGDYCLLVSEVRDSYIAIYESGEITVRQEDNHISHRYILNCVSKGFWAYFDQFPNKAIRRAYNSIVSERKPV